MNQLPRKTLYLLLVLIGVMALTAFVLWKGFTETTTEPAQMVEIKAEADLDFSLLQSEEVEYLESYEEIPKFEDEMKRDNPFSSYEAGTTSPAEEESTTTD